MPRSSKTPFGCAGEAEPSFKSALVMEIYIPKKSDQPSPACSEPERDPPVAVCGEVRVEIP